MFKLIIAVSMLLAGIFCQAQVSEVRETGHFSEIQISSGIQLVYTEADDVQPVKVEAPNVEVLQQLTTVSDGKRLSISFHGENNNKKAIKVYIASKNVTLFQADKSSQIRLANNIHAANLQIVLSSGATFNGYVLADGSVTVNAGSYTVFNGRIETGHFTGNFKNGAKINLSGTAGIATINSQSGAYCNGRNFITGQSQIASHNASVIITSKEEITVRAGENGSVTYQGSPKKAFRNREAFVIWKNKKALPSIIAMD